MSGVFTIGGTAPDFVSFQDAIDSMNVRGLAGPVSFNVRPGVYNEQLILTAILGASATNTILFQSENGDSSSVILSYNSTSSSFNYILHFDGASYVTFKKMTLQATGTTYARVIYMNGGSFENRILNNVLAGVVTTSTSSIRAVVYSPGDDDSYNEFRNNVIQNGSYGLYFNGEYNDYEAGTVVENNRFTNQYYTAMRLYYQWAPEVYSNIIQTSSVYSSFSAIYIGWSNNAFVLSENQISILRGYGIQLYYCQGDSLISSERGLVANNFVKVGWFPGRI